MPKLFYTENSAIVSRLVPLKSESTRTKLSQASALQDESSDCDFSVTEPPLK